LIDLYVIIYQSVTIQQAESFDGVLDSTILENLTKTSSRQTSLVTKEEPLPFRDNVEAKVDSEHGLVAVLIKKKNLLLISKYPRISQNKNGSTDNNNKLLSDPVILDLKKLGHYEAIDFCFMFGYVTSLYYLFFCNCIKLFSSYFRSFRGKNSYLVWKFFSYSRQSPYFCNTV